VKGSPGCRTDCGWRPVGLRRGGYERGPHHLTATPDYRTHPRSRRRAPAEAMRAEERVRGPLPVQAWSSHTWGRLADADLPSLSYRHLVVDSTGPARGGSQGSSQMPIDHRTDLPVNGGPRLAPEAVSIAEPLANTPEGRASGDEQERRDARVKTRIRACASMGGRYGAVIACVR
jgi:hypothetical protein